MGPDRRAADRVDRGRRGITLRQVWLDAPKWVIALPYVVVGWAAVAVLPQL